MGSGAWVRARSDSRVPVIISPCRLHSLSRRVSIRLAGDIQQQRRNARVGEMRGNARTHGARAKNSNTTNGSHKFSTPEQRHIHAQIKQEHFTFGIELDIQFARVRDPGAVTGMQLQADGESIGALQGQGPPTPALAHLDIDSEGFAWLPEDDPYRT